MDGKKGKPEPMGAYARLKSKIGLNQPGHLGESGHPMNTSSHPLVEHLKSQTNTGTADGMHPNLHHYMPTK